MGIIHFFHAQPSINDDLAHRRYWFYRTRLINDFTKIGTEQGDCMITPERSYGSPQSNTIRVGPDNIDIANQYLIALALEYHLLARNNQDTRETIKEIYHFLYAIDRLDIEADQFWTSSPSTSDHLDPSKNTAENGFMLREDMPGDYLSSAYNEKHFNYSMNEIGYDPLTGIQTAGYTFLPHIDALESSALHSYINWEPGFSTHDLTQPSEKSYSMFAAFMFLVKYIPPGTHYADDNGNIQLFPDGITSDFITEVRNITNRLHIYLRGNLFGLPTSNWLMEYPGGGTANGLGIPLLFSYALATAVCHINNPPPFIVQCPNYQDLLSQTTGAAAWHFANNNPSSLHLNPVLAGIIGGAAAVIVNNFTTNDLGVMLAYNQATSNDPGPLSISPMWLQMSWNTSAANLEWADLMRLVLHENGNMVKQESVYANPIDVAPCNGPYNFEPGNSATWEWSAQDRHEHQDSRGSSTPFPGYYPGVDYMVLHNLYYERLNQLDDAGFSQNGCYKNAINLMDNLDESVWPKQDPNNPLIPLGLTSLINPSGYEAGHVKTFQLLDSRAQFDIMYSSGPDWPSGSLEYRAGKEINLLPEDGLKPGFLAQGYITDFYAHIARYGCGSENNYTEGLRLFQDSNYTTNNDYETDNMNTKVAMHYYESPLYTGSANTNSTYKNLPASANNGSGQTKESNIYLSDINENKNFGYGMDTRFEVFPNPNNGVFRIVGKNVPEGEFFTLNIVDMKGEIIYNLANFISEDFDFRSYPKGIYLIKLNSNFGRFFSHKLSLTD